MKYPKLKAIYDLAEKPSINFEETTNVVLQHISPMELNNTEGPRSSGEAAFETVPLTPMQFQEVSQRMTGDDEFGFVMIPETRRSGGGNGEPVTDYHELDETFSQQVAKEQDEAIYQRHGAMSLCHFLVAWLMTILFIIYFVAIIALYGLFLGKIKPSQWFLQSIVNAFFNHFFRYVSLCLNYVLRFIHNCPFSGQRKGRLLLDPLSGAQIRKSVQQVASSEDAGSLLHRVRSLLLHRQLRRVPLYQSGNTLESALRSKTLR